MAIDIHARFCFELDGPADVLLQFEAAMIPEQRLLETDTWLTLGEHFARVPAEDDIGERIWLRAQGPIEVTYDARVEVQRIIADLADLGVAEPHDLPGSTVPYLFDSRYCPAERMHPFVESEFAGTSGGARIAAIRDWIESHFRYEPGVSNAKTTALDTLVERRGICRDFAHVMVTLARASTIPARFVSCYDPGVTPQDFHAVAEVFLSDPQLSGGGAWHLVDATGMADPATTVKIGVGRDAADVSFLTSFGPSHFISSEVSVARTD
ncbi:MAG: transglutaminase family protein [Sphingomonadales bacterium]|nr:transglutaminase family protein [Sphingomonadales bacterium]MBD3774005.1 transglutaminase family protein [Paracoccaceae bacterium]